MIDIFERPAEAVDRAVPGHWEGDFILGEGGRSAVGTLVERSTRLVLLLHLDGDRSAVTVEAAMRDAIATLPDELVRSITWDQGAEMATHATFTTATGIPIYFCGPHSPWQRGSNENTNGLLRQYLPKGTDLSKRSAADLVAIQSSLNNRPRKTLDYMTPSEAYAQVVAAAARTRSSSSSSNPTRDPSRSCPLGSARGAARQGRRRHARVAPAAIAGRGPRRGHTAVSRHDRARFQDIAEAIDAIRRHRTRGDLCDGLVDDDP